MVGFTRRSAGFVDASRRPVELLITLLICAAVGSVLPSLPDVSPLTVVGAALAIAVAVLVCRLGPRPCLLGLLIATVWGAYNYPLSLGPIDVRATDVFYFGLLLWAVHLRSRGAPRPSRIGQRQIGWFFVILAVSLVSFRSGDLLASSISLLRFIQTMSLLWLVPYAVRGSRDRIVVINVLSVTIAAELGYGLLFHSGGRFAGRNGPDVEGLLAAVLLLIAVRGATLPRVSHRVVLAVIGVLGLAQSESIGALLAVGLVFAFAGFRDRSQVPPAWRALSSALRAGLLVACVVIVVTSLRPENLPGSDEFVSSSTAHRAVLASAGLEIFERNPLFGVGWQQSSRPEVVGTPEISEALRDRFPDVNEGFFPDVNPGTVHNAYVQVLAETGIIGAALLVNAFVSVRRRTRALASRLDPSERAVFSTVRLALVAVLIWWNDNPLFGAQPETVLAALFIGLLASFRLPVPSTGSRQGDVEQPLDEPVEPVVFDDLRTKDVP